MATVKGTWVFNEKPQPYTGVGAAYIYSDTTPPTVYVGEAQTYGIAAYPAEGGFIPEILEDGVGIYMWDLSAAGKSMYLYETESWKDEAYRTVTFTEEVAVDDEAYAWLTANAVQQVSESTPTVKGVWVFNQFYNPATGVSNVNVNFTTNGQTYSHIAFLNDGWQIWYTIPGEVFAADDGEFWYNEAYRTIDFGETEQEVSQEFYDWFTANAVQQADEPEQEEPTVTPVTFDLSTLNLPAGTHTITVKARANGYADSAESAAVSYVVEATVNAYNITTNLSGCLGYSTNPTEIDEGESATLYFMANGGYSLPTSIYVSGAEYDWYWTSGELILRNPTGPVYVSISCAATGNTYDITVVNNASGIAVSTNPTQISEGETVELVFSTDMMGYATAVGADCEYTNVQTSFNSVTLTVTLSNPTGDVTVTVELGKEPPELVE